MAQYSLTRLVALAGLSIAFPAFAQNRTDEAPAELFAAQSSRMFLNGQVEYAVEQPATAVAPGYSGEPRGMIARFNGNDFFADEKGGVIAPGAGAPLRLRNLILDGKLFTNSGSSLSASMWDDGNPTAAMVRADDIRGLGLSPFRNDLRKSLDRVLWETGESKAGEAAKREYSVRSEGDVRIVTCHLDNNREIRWWINTKRGFGVERAQYLRDGEVLNESRTTLVKFGDDWFPEATIFVDKHLDKGQQQKCTFRIVDAQLNNENLKPLSLMDIGIDVGTSVQHHLADGTVECYPDKQPKFYTWDGRQLSDFREVMKRIEDKTLDLGPDVAAEIAECQADHKAYALVSADPVAFRLRLDQCSKLSFWDEYTARFIDENELKDDQKEAAWRICKDCKSQAGTHARRFEEAQPELGRLGDRTASLAESDPEKQSLRIKLVQRRIALQTPIVRIFEGQFVPRLDRLLTREQRAKRAEIDRKAGGDPSHSGRK